MRENMSLKKNHFDALTQLEVQQREHRPQKVEIPSDIKKELVDLEYLEGEQISPKGMEALEPYRVKRAIFFAAGFGSRMVPITLNTPKPLVRVHGERMIETSLRQLIKNGIEDIIIVRGYLGEEFEVLLHKYPTIRFIDNPQYNSANSISSAFLARDQIRDAYVLEADLLVKNPELITKYQYCSNYLGVPTSKTDDWCFETDHGRITAIKIGGTDCHHLFGISYWTAEDGQKLAGHIEELYHDPEGIQCCWDVAPGRHLEEYQLMVRECTFDDIAEIDSFDELKQVDPAYDC